MTGVVTVQQGALSEFSKLSDLVFLELFNYTCCSLSRVLPGEGASMQPDSSIAFRKDLHPILNEIRFKGLRVKPLSCRVLGMKKNKRSWYIELPCH